MREAVEACELDIDVIGADSMFANYCHSERLCKQYFYYLMVFQGTCYLQYVGEERNGFKIGSRPNTM